MPDPGRSPTDPVRSLRRRLLHNLFHRCGVRPRERLLVGVSGGADSVALLALLADVAPRLGLGLEVAHFDHALRPGSGDDARFVAELARGLGLECHTACWNAPRPGEAAARAARHAFLAATAVACGCSAIALAHHLDDQIETLLLRLERGSGLRGSLGMEWRREGGVPIVRPLLDVRRAALLQALAARGLRWREDPTNRDSRLERNRVRLSVVPVLDAALRPGWTERWAASLEELRAVRDWLDAAARELLAAARRPGSPPACDLWALRRAPEVVRRIALQQWLQESIPVRGGEREISRRHLEAASRIVQNGRNGRRLELPGGLVLRIENESAVLDRAERHPGEDVSGRKGGLAAPRMDGAASLADRRPVDPQDRVPAARPANLSPPPGRLMVEALPGADAWTALERQAGGAAASGARARNAQLPQSACALLGADALELPLALRQVRPGDWVRLLGAPGSRLLRRILQDRAVPPRLRALWPVVEDAIGIVWLPGLGVAERARIEPGTARALAVSYEAHRGPPRGSGASPDGT